MKKIKGKFIDPVGKNKTKREEFFEVREQGNKREFVLRSKNIPSDGKFIIGSDQEYQVNVNRSGLPEMQAKITVSGTNTETGEYFELGFIDGKYKILEGNPPRKLSLSISSENLYIITELLDKNSKN